MNRNTLFSSSLIRRRLMGRKSPRGRGTGARIIAVSSQLHPFYQENQQQQQQHQQQKQHHQNQHYALPQIQPQQQKKLVVYFTSTSNQDQQQDRITTNNNSSKKSSSSSSMALTHFFEQIQSPPNLITVTRIASAPLLCYFVITEQHYAALMGCFLAGLSDAADGYLAKQYNMSTVLGTYLDPLADKILINSLSVSLWYTAVLPGPLVALWLFKDVGLMTATYRHVAAQTHTHQAVLDPFTTPLKINPTWISKINTALQFVTVGVAIVAAVDTSSSSLSLWQNNNNIMIALLEPLCWLTGTTTILSVGSYVGYSGFLSSGNKENEKNEEGEDGKEHTEAAATTTTTGDEDANNKDNK